MKKLILIFFFSVYISIGIQAQESNQNNEIIFVVDMTVINDKTDVEVEDFSVYYTLAIKDNEPQTLGWGFYESDDKVVLIERYTDSKAMIKHAKNISLEGPMQHHFIKFMDHFIIKKIDVYGNTSEEMKALLESFKLPFIYHTAFASFSRN